MSTTISVAAEEEVLWPNRCAMCGSKEKLVAAGASVGRVTSVRPNFSGGVTVKSELLSLAYPVCAEHSKGLWWASLVTRKTTGFTWLRGALYFFGPLSISLFLLMGFRLLLPKSSRVQTEMPWEMLSIYVLFAVGFVVVILAYRKLPLRLLKKGEESVTIKFRNEAYASEFARLNKDITTIN